MLLPPSAPVGAAREIQLRHGPAAEHATETMTFLRPMSVGDEVSCFCTTDDEGETSPG